MQTQGFTHKTGLLLQRADTLCDSRGCRLTDIRRHVLGLVLESDKPVGAYDLLERLRTVHRGAAPPTVYRALDFLLEQGLIHKVERLSAFVGCVHDTASGAHHHHAAQFLICTRCGRTIELDDADVAAVLGTAAARAGFVPQRSTVEIEGLCAACAD